MARKILKSISYIYRKSMPNCSQELNNLFLLPVKQRIERLINLKIGESPQRSMGKLFYKLPQTAMIINLTSTV
jgi:hypothetical protein